MCVALQVMFESHEPDAAPILSAALALDARCEGDHKLDRALQRVGFSGLIGSPAM